MSKKKITSKQKTKTKKSTKESNIYIYIYIYLFILPIELMSFWNEVCVLYYLGRLRLNKRTKTWNQLCFPNLCLEFSALLGRVS